MKVAVIGSGGREHALAALLIEDREVNEIFSLPGNPGTGKLGTNIKIEINNVDEVRKSVKEICPDLVIIGPEQPISEGLADYLRRDGFIVFGPDAEGAKIESDKIFAKTIMQETGIPTAKWFEISNAEIFKNSLEKIHSPYVLKASGLAGGKGVFIVDDKEAAIEKAEEMLKGEILKGAGNKFVLEEYIRGVEASFFYITDGRKYIQMIPARDYKKVGEGDIGPNTGGMGAIAPVRISMNSTVEEKILLPLMDYLKWKKINYRGVIYIGVIIDQGEVKVLEFNCRFGDPETQVILPLVQEGLFNSLYSAASGSLERSLTFKTDIKTTGVVIASRNYPMKPETGFNIEGVENITNPDLSLFYSGTEFRNEKLINTGGRVFTLVGKGETFQKSRELVYSNIDSISFEGVWYRKDIGMEK